MQSTSRWRLAQFLELRWWKNYLSGKDPVIYLRDKRAYWQRVFGEIGHKPVAGARVLDAGCGPAGVFILVHANQEVTALDPLLLEYEEKLSIFKREDYPSVRFITERLERAVLTTAPFDTIYCFNAINHVADWEQCFQRLAEWAAPGTRLIISSDVHRHRWLLPIFRALPGDALHPQQHRAADYRKALVAGGWRIEREDRLKRELIFDYVCWTAVKNEKPS